MKVSKRMKKILLFLLHPENTFEWFKENRIPITESDCYRHWDIMTFCAKKSHFRDFSDSEIVSFNRTFRILKRHGFVERGTLHLPEGIYEYGCYKLTNKGRKIAKDIEKEIRGLMKEYEYLVS